MKFGPWRGPPFFRQIHFWRNKPEVIDFVLGQFVDHDLKSKPKPNKKAELFQLRLCFHTLVTILGSSLLGFLSTTRLPLTRKLAAHMWTAAGFGSIAAFFRRELGSFNFLYFPEHSKAGTLGRGK